MKFLRDTWYMLAWSDEIADQPFARTVLGEAIVVFREIGSGRLAALRDRCPHRFAPLSRGRVTEIGIECPYHGLQFNGEGRCMKNPFSPVAPAAARVRGYPLHESDGTIWIWMGDPAKADVAKVPVVAHHAAAYDQPWVKGTTTTAGDYRLICDNLMDLTHTFTVHPGLGGRDYVPKVRSWEEANGDILVEFRIPSMPNFFGEDVIPSAQVQHCDTMRWIAPSVHLLDSRTGLPGSDEVLVHIPAAHILTPETETSTHYFWSSGCPTGVPADAVRQALVQAFDVEDKAMIQAVQAAMNGADLWELDPVLLPTDAGGVRMRRKLAALIEAEAPAQA